MLVNTCCALLALFFDLIDKVEQENINDYDDEKTQNWKTIKAYFSSPAKLYELIQDSVSLLQKDKITEDNVEMAGELILNFQEVKNEDKNSINESVKVLYDFIVAFLDYYNILQGKTIIMNKRVSNVSNSRVSHNEITKSRERQRVKSLHGKKNENESIKRDESIKKAVSPTPVKRQNRNEDDDKEGAISPINSPDEATKEEQNFGNSWVNDLNLGTEENEKEGQPIESNNRDSGKSVPVNRIKIVPKKLVHQSSAEKFGQSKSLTRAEEKKNKALPGGKKSQSIDNFSEKLISKRLVTDLSRNEITEKTENTEQTKLDIEEEGSTTNNRRRKSRKAPVPIMKKKKPVKPKVKPDSEKSIQKEEVGINYNPQGSYNNQPKYTQERQKSLGGKQFKSYSPNPAKNIVNVKKFANKLKVNTQAPLFNDPSTQQATMNQDQPEEQMPIDISNKKENPTLISKKSSESVPRLNTRSDGSVEIRNMQMQEGIDEQKRPFESIDEKTISANYKKRSSKSTSNLGNRRKRPNQLPKAGDFKSSLGPMVTQINPVKKKKEDELKWLAKGGKNPENRSTILEKPPLAHEHLNSEGDERNNDDDRPYYIPPSYSSTKKNNQNDENQYQSSLEQMKNSGESGLLALHQSGDYDPNSVPSKNFDKQSPQRNFSPTKKSGVSPTKKPKSPVKKPSSPTKKLGDKKSPVNKESNDNGKIPNIEAEFEDAYSDYIVDETPKDGDSNNQKPSLNRNGENTTNQKTNSIPTKIIERSIEESPIPKLDDYIGMNQNSADQLKNVLNHQQSQSPTKKGIVKPFNTGDTNKNQSPTKSPTRNPNKNRESPTKNRGNKSPSKAKKDSDLELAFDHEQAESVEIDIDIVEEHMNEQTENSNKEMSSKNPMVRNGKKVQPQNIKTKSQLLGKSATMQNTTKSHNNSAFAMQRGSSLLGISNKSVGGKVTEYTKEVRDNIMEKQVFHGIKNESNRILPTPLIKPDDQNVVQEKDGTEEDEQNGRQNTDNQLVSPTKSNNKYSGRKNIPQRNMELKIDIKNSVNQLFKDFKKPAVIYTPHNSNYCLTSKTPRYEKIMGIKTNKPNNVKSIVKDFMTVEGSVTKYVKKHRGTENININIIDEEKKELLRQKALESEMNFKINKEAIEAVRKEREELEQKELEFRAAEVYSFSIIKKQAKRIRELNFGRTLKFKESQQQYKAAEFFDNVEAKRAIDKQKFEEEEFEREYRVIFEI